MNDLRSESSPSTGPEPGPSQRNFNFWRWFWLSTIPVSLGWLWHDFYAPENHIAWAKDYASAEQQAAGSGKPMILFFTGAWCSPCRIMKRNVWADGQVEATVNARFTPVMIDMDDPQAAAVVSRYRVFATPTTVITDPNGKILLQVQGGIDKTHFLGLLAQPNLSASTP